MMPDSIPFYLSDYMISKLKWLTFLQKLKNKQCVSTQITVKHMSFNSAKKEEANISASSSFKIMISKRPAAYIKRQLQQKQLPLQQTA